MSRSRGVAAQVTTKRQPPGGKIGLNDRPTLGGRFTEVSKAEFDPMKPLAFDFMLTCPDGTPLASKRPELPVVAVTVRPPEPTNVTVAPDTPRALVASTICPWTLTVTSLHDVA